MCAALSSRLESRPRPPLTCRRMPARSVVADHDCPASSIRPRSHALSQSENSTSACPFSRVRASSQTSSCRHIIPSSSSTAARSWYSRSFSLVTGRPQTRRPCRFQHAARAEHDQIISVPEGILCAVQAAESLFRGSFHGRTSAASCFIQGFMANPSAQRKSTVSDVTCYDTCS